MKRRTFLASTSAVATLATVGATVGAGPAAAKAKVKAGYIYVGPVGDFGWSYQHNQGRLAAEKALGGAMESTYVESVPEGADAERVMTQMALKGADIIFAT